LPFPIPLEKMLTVVTNYVLEIQALEVEWLNYTWLHMAKFMPWNYPSVLLKNNYMYVLFVFSSRSSNVNRESLKVALQTSHFWI